MKSVFSRKDWSVGVVLGFFCHLAHGSILYQDALNDNCGDEISMILAGVYQAKYTLDVMPDFNQPFYPHHRFNYSVCDTHIQAWYNKPKLMFYIDSLDLNCSEGYLQFFDGYVSIDVDTKPYSDLQNVCGPNYPTSVYTTTSRELRVRYMPRQLLYKYNVLNLIVTAFDDDRDCEGYEYKCGNGRCIDGDEACNGFNSCGDNSSCRLPSWAIVLIAVGSGIVLIAVGSVVACLVCAQRQINRRRVHQQVPAFQQPVSRAAQAIPTQYSTQYGAQYNSTTANFGKI